MSKTTRPKINYQIPKQKTSQTQRPKSVADTILEKYPRLKNKKFNFSTITTFGRDSPKFTIPSSRKEDYVLFPLPGPGEYNVVENEKQTLLNCTFPKSKVIDNKRALTANIDYTNYRMFPEVKQSYIGVKDNHDVFYINDSPGPGVVQMPPQRKISIRIPNKYKERALEFPNIGPGCYDQSTEGIDYHIHGYRFSGPKERNQWMVTNDDMPGPGEYTPVLSVAKVRSRAIGKKSRHKKNVAPRPPKDLIAIDQIIIHLENLPDPKRSRQYIISKPAIRDVVHEIIETVLYSRPDDPVAFIKEYFAQIRDSA